MAMSPGVLGVVLVGALLHASWNVLIKGRPNTHLTMVGLYIAAGVLALVMLPALGLPARAAWPYLAASTVAEVIYGALLAATYQAGELSHTYPLMRGGAPLLVALASGPLVGESLSRWMVAGVALVSAGILSLWFEARSQRRSARATRLALLNACAIATYTTIDGLGVRVSGHPASYSLTLFVLIGAAWTLWALRPRGAGARAGAGEVPSPRMLWTQAPVLLAGAACMLGSYGLALWAMTRAPVAAVAAARESSIVMTTVLGVLMLHERVSPVRALAVLTITLGVWLVRAG
jgi:drug/metabolite transporter (DMT)-like permease